MHQFLFSLRTNCIFFLLSFYILCIPHKPRLACSSSISDSLNSVYAVLISIKEPLILGGGGGGLTSYISEYGDVRSLLV